MGRLVSICDEELCLEFGFCMMGKLVGSVGYEESFPEFEFCIGVRDEGDGVEGAKVGGGVSRKSKSRNLGGSSKWSSWIGTLFAFLEIHSSNLGKVVIEES
jgi:hypothetical protein